MAKTVHLVTFTKSKRLKTITECGEPVIGTGTRCSTGRAKVTCEACLKENSND